MKTLLKMAQFENGMNAFQCKRLEIEGGRLLLLFLFESGAISIIPFQAFTIKLFMLFSDSFIFKIIFI